MTIAKGYDRLGLDLESHISRYTPENWIVPISNVAHSPFVMTDEAKILMQAYRDNSLDKTLEKLGSSFEPWYVKEAVKDYFTKEKFSGFADELKEEDK